MTSFRDHPAPRLPDGGAPGQILPGRGEMRGEGSNLVNPIEADRLRKAQASGWATCVGCDLSYSGAGDQAAFVAVSMQRGLPWYQCKLFVRDVFAGRKEIKSLRQTLVAWRVAFPDAVFASFISGAEMAVLALLEEEFADESGVKIPGVSIFPMLASQSKRSRAAATEEAWSGGRIMVPRDKPWSQKFVRQVQAFTGRDGDSDDVIDAMVSAVEFLRLSAGDYSGLQMTARRTRF